MVFVHLNLAIFKYYFNIFIIMRKVIIAILALFLLVGVASASPTLKTYAESGIVEINDVNFTITTNWQDVSADSNSSFKMFKDGNKTLTISVEDGKSLSDVKQVESNKTISAENTTVGSLEGYYVDNNGTCMFAYEDSGKLITINAPNLSVVIDVIGVD